jgi:hypothetical protein
MSLIIRTIKKGVIGCILTHMEHYLLPLGCVVVKLSAALINGELAVSSSDTLRRY